MRRLLQVLRGGVCLLAGVTAVWSAGASRAAGENEFFEQKIRPVLVAECYECHSAKKIKGGLRLDYRAGWQAGGDSGDVIAPGDPGNSRLIAAIKHVDEDLKMPDKAPKLADAVIADFEKWVTMGAADPRDEPPKEEGARPSWEELFTTRKTWWSLQPVTKPMVPTTKNATWSAHPVDRFLLEKMEANALEPAADADPGTVIRRLSFALTGLPPTPDETEAFVRDAARGASSAVRLHVDRLLASPRFGEQWARHWMDLMRYAETHGSEGDPVIPEAWRYRDYLIRAFNADLPADQLIREHLAGDLIAPRLSAAGINESMLGIAHFRLVEHGFQPVDTLDDQVKTVDNQIDVVSKAFQGLTVSCARCHDHKFDAVSQRDYYALYGVFASCRPAQVTIDAPEVLAKNRAELESLHAQIKTVLAGAWRTAVDCFGQQLGASSGDIGSPSSDVRHSGIVREAWVEALCDAGNDVESPLHLWVKLSTLDQGVFAAAWQTLATALRDQIAEAQRFNRANFRLAWDLGGEDYARWYPLGTGLAGGPVRPGDFAVTLNGDRILDGIAPAGAFTRRLSDKHNALFSSPRFTIETDSISVHAFGGGGAMVRVMVDNYPLPLNPIFPKAVFAGEKPGWIRLDTAYRKGSSVYLEFATRDDLTRPIDDSKQKDVITPRGGRSFFGVNQVVFHDGKSGPRLETVAILPLLDGPSPKSAAELAVHYQRVLDDAIISWREDRLSEPQRALIDFFVRRGLLPVTLSELETARSLVTEYRRLEAEVPVPQRAPGVIETQAYDSPLLVRGDHLKPGENVPRRYLQVIDPTRYRGPLSGRLELANAIASPTNPLTARVMVNRVWHWLYGRGLVPTVDNFGRLGEKPTHPELLDFLAARLIEHSWSIKDLIRFLVTTRTFQITSTPSPEARERDAANVWLSNMRVRRVEAEAIRDSLLAVSGNLHTAMFGPSVESNTARRSIYLPVQRTKLDAFLQVFDAPKPFTTLGRRESTNVPAQSLTLLNSPFVVAQAAAWARAEVQTETVSPATRISRMFRRALARPPQEGELAASLQYLTAAAREREVAPEALLASEAVWQDFAQSLFNLKEFIYVR